MKYIKFRGKSIEEGIWVYGSLIIKKENVFIYTPSEDCMVPIKPETVGRLIEYPCWNCHGMNSEIYEGDIMNVYTRHDFHYENIISKAIAVDEDSIMEENLGRRFPQDTVHVKVIGNVHDTPEIIGEKYANLYKLYHGFEFTTR